MELLKNLTSPSSMEVFFFKESNMEVIAEKRKGKKGRKEKAAIGWGQGIGVVLFC